MNGPGKRMGADEFSHAGQAGLYPLRYELFPVKAIVYSRTMKMLLKATTSKKVAWRPIDTWRTFSAYSKRMPFPYALMDLMRCR
jgi:hypothetical protein